VTGLLTASNASGQLVFLPALAWVAGFDWRYAAIAVAVAALAVALPVVVAFLRDSPEEIGERPYGAAADWRPLPASQTSFGAAFGALSRAARTRTFWLLAATFFVCGATTNGLVSTHLIPAAHDHGITAVTAAGLLALIGLFDVVGTTASGWLTDRYDPRKLLFAYYALRGVSLLFLPLAFDSAHATLIAFAVVYGLDWVATVPPTVALTADRLSRAHVGVIFGWIFASHQLGAAAAAWGAGWIRDDTGGYSTAFTIAGALALAAAVLALWIASARRDEVPAPAVA
jgi:predicted MFS family arabinose efflux permease